MLHLMGAIQNCKEQGGIFLYFGVPPPSTPAPEAVPMRSSCTSEHALTDRDIRIAWELFCYAASDGGHPEQQ